MVVVSPSVSVRGPVRVFLPKEWGTFLYLHLQPRPKLLLKVELGVVLAGWTLLRRSMSVPEWHACRDEDASPSEWLHAAAKATGHAVDSAEFAAWLDESDPLRTSREKFHIPEHQPGQEQIYLCGNSLGPVPRATAAAVQAELQKWAMGGVSGHFTGELPWATCEEVLPALMADVVGAEDAKLEVAAMNSLTVNLHMLMASFYRPSAGRGAILIEAGAFPSDRIAVVTQLRNHGLDPATELIEVAPRADTLLYTEDTLAAI